MDNLVGAGGHCRVFLTVIAQDDDIPAVLRGNDVVGVAVGAVVLMRFITRIVRLIRIIRDFSIQFHQRVAVIPTQSTVAGALVVGILKSLTVIRSRCGRMIRL